MTFWGENAYFVRISDTSCQQFGRGRGQEDVFGTKIFLGEVVSPLKIQQEDLKLLVQGKLNHHVHEAKHRGSESPVEAPIPFILEDGHNGVRDSSVVIRRDFRLGLAKRVKKKDNRSFPVLFAPLLLSTDHKTSFHNPQWVRGGRACSSCTHGSDHVHPVIVLLLVCQRSEEEELAKELKKNSKSKKEKKRSKPREFATNVLRKSYEVK